MIQLSDIKSLKEENISKLVTLITPELQRKKELYKRYSRKASELEIEGTNTPKVIVPLEKYCVDVASGFLGGKEPTYEVENVQEEKKNIIQKLLDKVFGNKDYATEMEALIDYITKYNDDGTEHYQLIKDILSTGSCYEIMYENDKSEIVYSRVSPLQTVAIWDYSIPKNLIGVARLHTEKDINGKTTYVVQLTDDKGTRVFKGAGSEYKEVIEKDPEGNILYDNHNWKDVPFNVVEVPDGTALFEPAISLIKAYERLIQNTKDTFQYNNDAKLKVTGYRPDEPLMTEDENGNPIVNPKRIAEDETLLSMKVFYTPDDGDINWIIKDIPDTAIQNTLKTYIDLVLMVTGLPNTTDLGFTKADNASAIDRKFFTLEQTTIQSMQLLTMAYKRRWELIFDRINLEKGTKYDFRDVKITLPRNLPANENEIVDMYMKLRGLISDETIIERLPLNFDSTSELNKMDEQDQKNLEQEVNKAQAFNNDNSQPVGMNKNTNKLDNKDNISKDSKEVKEDDKKENKEEAQK